MEFRSPGALLSTINVADLQELKGAHESRNPMVARVLKDHKYMRELWACFILRGCRDCRSVSWSPDDIYRAMNTEDRDTYDFEVTGLRKSGILDEIRSSPAAQQMARSRRVPKPKVPRFKVRNPASVRPDGQSVVQPATLLAEGPSRELYPEETGVFIGNLDPSVTEAELRAIFSRFGQVRKVIMNWDKRPGVASKYAVLWLGSADEATAAIDAL